MCRFSCITTNNPTCSKISIHKCKIIVQTRSEQKQFCLKRFYFHLKTCDLLFNASGGRSSSVYSGWVFERLKIVLQIERYSPMFLFIVGLYLCARTCTHLISFNVMSVCLIFECHWILSIVQYLYFFTNDTHRPVSRISRIRGGSCERVAWLH